MRAIQSLHSGAIECVVSPLGTGFGSGVTVTCRMNFHVLPGSQIPPRVEVTRDWPCNSHATLVAHVYRLLFDLDHAISKVYRQEGLWK